MTLLRHMVATLISINCLMFLSTRILLNENKEKTVTKDEKNHHDIVSVELRNSL